MLNRRYIRIKVLQALYSFYYDEAKDMALKEKDLIRSIDNIYSLYVYLMVLLKEIRRQAERIIEERKKKHLPSADDLNPNLKFVFNTIFRMLADSKQLAAEVKKRSISWQEDDSPIIKELFRNISGSAEYAAYMNEPEVSFEADRQFMSRIYKKFMSENESLKHHLFEKNIHWAGDYVLANLSVVKTIEGADEKGGLQLMPVFKEDDDKDFMLDLYRKTIMSDTDNIKLISHKMSNWEPDRLASIDFLLLKMAITELMNFPAIPVKVTLNEYIEISKLYSSPKSNSFINGILDAIVQDLNKKKKILKTGRGLLE